MSGQPILCIPPVADPGTANPTPSVSSFPPALYGALSQASGNSLSEILLFLQEILLEYEETQPDWRASPLSIALMNSIRDKLEAAEAALTPPTFTEQEQLYLQEILFEYQETHSDWRRKLAGFYLMLGIDHAIGEDALGSGSGSGSGGSGSGSDGISSPPTADPYLYQIPQPTPLALDGFGPCSIETPCGPINTAIWPIGAQGNQGNQGLTGPQGTGGGAQGNQGAQGAQGAAGNQGGVGVSGSPGSQGNQGAAGAAGATGASGSAGSSGAQGPQGVSVTGPQGNQGSAGSDGGSGPQGNQGDVGPQGNQGAASTVPGPQGSSGGGATSFTFTQGLPASTWVIAHNLGTYPSVTIVDSSGNWVVGGVHYDSANQVTLTFSGAFSGTAVLI